MEVAMTAWYLHELQSFHHLVRHAVEKYQNKGLQGRGTTGLSSNMDSSSLAQDRIPQRNIGSSRGPFSNFTYQWRRWTVPEGFLALIRCWGFLQSIESIFGLCIRETGCLSFSVQARIGTNYNTVSFGVDFVEMVRLRRYRFCLV